MPPENTVHRGLECRQADSSFHPMCAGAHKKDVDSDYIRKMQSAALPGNTGTAGSSVLILSFLRDAGPAATNCLCHRHLMAGAGEFAAHGVSSGRRGNSHRRKIWAGQNNLLMIRKYKAWMNLEGVRDT